MVELVNEDSQANVAAHQLRFLTAGTRWLGNSRPKLTEATKRGRVVLFHDNVSSSDHSESFEKLWHQDETYPLSSSPETKRSCSRLYENLPRVSMFIR
jgi:hypothetical protein